MERGSEPRVERNLYWGRGGEGRRGAQPRCSGQSGEMGEEGMWKGKERRLVGCDVIIIDTPHISRSWCDVTGAVTCRLSLLRYVLLWYRPSGR